MLFFFNTKCFKKIIQKNVERIIQDVECGNRIQILVSNILKIFNQIFESQCLNMKESGLGFICII